MSLHDAKTHFMPSSKYSFNLGVSLIEVASMLSDILLDNNHETHGEAKKIFKIREIKINLFM